jgi:peptidoglycan/xylan/chitin deacetylase (PgdA/CDA1 family)
MIEGRLKQAIFRTADRTGFIAMCEASARGPVILAYHGVTEAGGSPLGNQRRLHVPKALFEQHLQFLCARWEPVPLSTLLDAMCAGEPLPRRAVVVTIDDGYRNTLTVALPLLRKFRVPATVFVLTGPRRERRMWIDRLEAMVEASSVPVLRWAGRLVPLTSIAAKAEAIRLLTPMFRKLRAQRETALEELYTLLGNPPQVSNPDRDLLASEEVRALRNAGLEIGSHSGCHEPLTERPLNEAQSTLATSRISLELELGTARYAFSYPYGAWNSQLAKLVREVGFYCAVTTDPGVNAPGTDPFGLRRFLVGADDDVPRLRASLSGLRSFWKRSQSAVW